MVADSTHSDIFSGVESIPELISARAKMAPGHIGMLDWITPHDTRATSWCKFKDYTEQAARQLQIYGCQSGDAIAIMASVSVLWDIVQYAVLMNGGIVVGIDTHDTDVNIQSIMASANIRGVITDNAEHLEKIDVACREKLSFVLYARPIENQDNFEFTALNEKSHPEKSDFREWPVINGDDPATIIFTSGTTGEPKGIPYTHKQILIACQALTKTYHDVTDQAELVCWLPLSNLFQRMMNYCALAVGAKTHYVSTPKKILNYLPVIKPTVFIAVPRFYEKLYEGIQSRINQAPLPVKLLFSFSHAMNCWAATKTNKNLLAIFIKKATGALFFNKLKMGILGSNLIYAISGSAPMPVWLLRWFEATGILILEAYGISENVVPISANTPQEYKFGTVGRPILPNKVRLSKNKEIEVTGPGVFVNYLSGKPDQKNISSDGYLQTGDEGRIDRDGFIALCGRKNDFFKTSTGIRISPLSIEKTLSRCRQLEGVIIIGEGRKVPIACATVNLSGDNYNDTNFFKVLRKEIKGYLSREIPDNQKPAAVLLLLTEFSVTGGEMTANLKLRKKLIIEKYGQEIERSYEILQKGPHDSPHQKVGEKGILIIL